MVHDALFSGGKGGEPGHERRSATDALTEYEGYRFAPGARRNVGTTTSAGRAAGVTHLIIAVSLVEAGVLTLSEQFASPFAAVQRVNGRQTL